MAHQEAHPRLAQFIRLLPLIVFGGLFLFLRYAQSRPPPDPYEDAVTAADSAAVKADSVQKEREKFALDVELTVRALCEIWTRNALNEPRSARFPGRRLVDTTRINDNTVRYIVEGEVEAQNAFGAMLRRGYQCTADADSTGMVAQVKPVVFFR